MNPTDQQVDDFLERIGQWREELRELRRILLDCGLKEDFKWRSPCYTYRDANVAIIQTMKGSCVLSFFKGSLLQDAHGILSKPGEHTQAARILRFKGLEEIRDIEPILKVYIGQAIELEKTGQKVAFADNAEIDFVEELKERLRSDDAFSQAFKALTPGRQRAYNIHFSAALRPATRVARIEKCTPRILSGLGLNDCTCGLSRKMPYCDGSHKFA